MAGKIYIGDAAGRGLQFGWKGLGLSLRYAWPALILMFVGVLFWEKTGLQRDPFADIDPAMSDVDWPAFFWAILFFVPGYLLFLPLIVRLTRMAADEADAPSGLFYFRWGEREGRYLAALFLLFFLLMMVLIGMMLPVVVGMSLFNLNGTTPAVVGVLIMVATAVFFLWVMVRATLLLASVAIENRIAFAEAFGKTKGQFWPLFGAVLLLSLALVGIQFMIGIVSFAAGFVLAMTGLAVEDGSLALIPFHLIDGLVSIFGQVAMIGLAGAVWQTLVPPRTGEGEPVVTTSPPPAGDSPMETPVGMG